MPRETERQPQRRTSVARVAAALAGADEAVRAADGPQAPVSGPRLILKLLRRDDLGNPSRELSANLSEIQQRLRQFILQNR